MKHFLGFFLCLFILTRLSAQNKTFTLSLYYAINETSSIQNLNRVDSLLTALGTSTCEIRIYGYADYLHTDVYNQVISQRRADAVKTYILKNETSHVISVKACEGLGEKNSTAKKTAEGDAGQRRVDLVVDQLTAVKKIGTRDNKIQEEIPKKETLIPITTEKKIQRKSVSGKKGIEDLEKGETLAIEGLSFIPGRHVVVRSAIPILENLLETLKEHPELKIEIQGHICCLDEAEADGFDYDTHERNLSESRAQAVYNYLVRNGIDKERLTYKGYGHTNPKIKIERSPADEQVNRRVEIRVLEN